MYAFDSKGCRAKFHCSRLTTEYECHFWDTVSLYIQYITEWTVSVSLCGTQAPAVLHAGLWCPLHCLVVRSSSISKRLTPRTEDVIALCHAIRASWLSRSPTRSTLRWRKMTSGVRASTSERSNEASFPPLTPPISAYLTTVCFYSKFLTCLTLKYYII